MVRLKLQRTHHVPFPVDHQLLYKSSHQDQAHPRKNPAALRTAAPPWDGRPRALHPGLVVTVALVTATVGHTWHTHVFAPNGMVITFQNIFKTTAVTTFPELRIKRALREESNSGSSSSEQSHECRQVNHSEDSCPRRAPAWAAARTPHLCPLSGSPMETARTGEAGERAGRPVHPPPSTSTSQTNDLSWGPSTGRQGENKSREVVKMGTVGILDPSLFWASVQDQGRAAIQHHSLRSDWCPRRPQPQHPHLFPAPKTPRQVTREHFSYQHPHVYINSEHVLAAEQREGGGPEDTARGGKTASQDTGGGGGAGCTRRQSHPWAAPQAQALREEEPLLLACPGGARQLPAGVRMATPAAPQGLPSPWRSGPTRCSSCRWWIWTAAAGTPWSQPPLCLHTVCKGAQDARWGLVDRASCLFAAASQPCKLLLGRQLRTREKIRHIHGTQEAAQKRGSSGPHG